MDLWDLIPANWQKLLAHEQDSLAHIGQHLGKAQSQGAVIAPKVDHIFRVLDLDAPDVSVIIVGQDPYPTQGHATGLAFSVPENTQPLPPTLKNILMEVRDDIGQTQCETGDLTAWHQQGVFLLNRVLTTEVGSAAAHVQIGWQRVTQTIIELIVTVNPQVIGVLWGNQAKDVQNLFSEQQVLQSVHPSPLSAYRGFIGSKPFSRVNEMLDATGRSSIIW